MARKTIEVERIREAMNTALAVPASSYHAESFEGKTPEQIYRMAIAGFGSMFLMESGNYHGFAYLSTETTEDGTLRSDYDDTRRKYY